MSSDKRDSMSRKKPTQVELERQNSDLKRRVQQLEKRLKQALRQLRDQEDIDYDAQLALDLEQEAAFQDMLSRTPSPVDDFIEVHLPNGVIKKIRKRVANE